MTAFWATIDQWGFAAAHYLLEALWQSTLAFGAVALLSLALRRHTRARHALWLVALLIAPALPLLSALVEPILPQQSVANFPVYTAPDIPIPEPLPAPEVTTTQVLERAEPTQIVTPPPALSDYPWALALLVYGFGVLLFLGWTLLGLFSIHRWTRSGRVATTPAVVAAFNRAAELLNVRRPVRVLFTDRIPAPVTAGVFRPTVLLPADISASFTAEDLYAVALHETVHIQQREPLILTVSSLIRCLLFFHPLVWVACRRLAVLAEHNADDMVLEITGAPVGYARLITAFAERLPLRTPATECAAGLVFCRSAFLKRVEAILGDRNRVGRLTRLTLAVTVVAFFLSLATALALPLGSTKQLRDVAPPATTASAVEPIALASSNAPAVPEQPKGFGGTPPAPKNETKPGALDVVDAHAQWQDKLVRFVAHYREERNYEGRMETFGRGSDRLTAYYEGWICQDFEKARTVLRENTWRVHPGHETATQENPEYRIYRWVDGVYHQYSSLAYLNDLFDAADLTRPFRENPLQLLVHFPGTTALGYAEGDYRRMDQKLAGADLVLRPEQERVGDSKCYVIEADTVFGLITAWFDPGKDYALAKYTVERGPEDIDRENLTLAQAFKVDRVNTRDEVTVEKFANADGVWLPARFTHNHYAWFPGGDYHKSTETTTIDVWYANPDLEALGAFSLDEIPDDSIWINGAPPTVFYRWNGGDLQPVTDDERALQQYQKEHPTPRPVPWKPAGVAPLSSVTPPRAPSDVRFAVQVNPGTPAPSAPLSGIGGTPPSPETEAAASAQRILDVYGSSQDKLRGFAAHYQKQRQFEGKVEHLPGGSGSFVEYFDGWACEDFAKQQTICREKVWGQQGVGFKIFPKDDPVYRIHRLADGAYHQYDNVSQANTICTEPADVRRFYGNPFTILAYFPGTVALGYTEGDYRRIDKKLAGAELSLRPGMERVGDSDCCVIEADTCFGFITAWFDPAKEYALAKYVVERGPNDIQRDNLTVAQAFKLDEVTLVEEMTVLKFVHSNGMWLPAKFTSNTYASFAQGDRKKNSETTTIDVWYANPDLEAMRAFELSDVPDDSIWINMANQELFYRWNGGNLEPVADNFQAMIAYVKRNPAPKPAFWQPAVPLPAPKM